jgi:hypothetical protein
MVVGATQAAGMTMITPEANRALWDNKSTRYSSVILA